MAAEVEADRKPVQLKIKLIHGSAKYEIELESAATVQSVAEKVFQLTHVPLSRQRLICRGQSLTEYGKSLEACGLKNGAKILLIGKKHDPAEEETIMLISKIEKNVNQAEEKCVEISQDYSELQQGFLKNSMTEEYFSRLEKKAKCNEEELMKAVEALDGMVLEGSFQEAKNKKKNLTKRALNLLAKIEKLELAMQEYKADKEL